MIDLTPIFQAIIALLAALITYKLIPLIRKKTTEDQFEKLKAVAETAVYAAEKIYGAGNGEEKLRWAIAYLEKNGFTLDQTILRGVVEQAVYNMLPDYEHLTDRLISTTDKPPDDEEEATENPEEPGDGE